MESTGHLAGWAGDLASDALLRASMLEHQTRLDRQAPFHQNERSMIVDAKRRHLERVLLALQRYVDGCTNAKQHTLATPPLFGEHTLPRRCHSRLFLK